jgi:hypothetical protein
MTARAARRPPLLLAGQEVPAGRKRHVELPLGALVTGTPISLTVQALHGRTDGPRVWLTAAIHGDEVAGVEIIRRVLAQLDARSLAGTLLAIPVVNVHGFVTGDRYLPDRRDLNRSFPGSPRGSMASRIASIMMREVIEGADVGIDLHTGAFGRTNLPQIRADLDDPRTLELARVFGSPIAIHAPERDGSLRQAARETGQTVLLFEGGEALRFGEHAIAAGTAGVLRVLEAVGMIEGVADVGDDPVLSRRTGWIRATRSGVVHPEHWLGDRVAKGGVVARVVGPQGERLGRLTARHDGVVIGIGQHPLVNRGDAVIHIADVGPGNHGLAGGSDGEEGS